MPKTTKRAKAPRAKKNLGGRPKKPADVKRKKTTLGLTDEEREAFARTAAARGLTVAAWIRGLGRKESGLDP